MRFEAGNCPEIEIYLGSFGILDGLNIPEESNQEVD